MEINIKKGSLKNALLMNVDEMETDKSVVSVTGLYGHRLDINTEKSN